MSTVSLPVASMVEVAVTCAVAGLGTVLGAVYKPFASTVPQRFAPASQTRLQVKVCGATSGTAAAVNCWETPLTTFSGALLLAFGVTVTVIWMMVRSNDPDLVVFSTEVATTLMAAGLGATAG